MPYKRLRPDDETSPRGTVYLLHFDQPFVGAPSRPDARRQIARHYTGWTAELDRRLVEHASLDDHGARLLAHVAAAGIGWQLARTWENVTRRRERAVKNQGATRFCPICRAERPR